MERRTKMNQKSARHPTNEHNFDFIYVNRLLSALPPTEFRFSVLLTLGLSLFLLSAPICLAVETTPDSLELAKVDRYLSNQLEELNIPGAALV